MPSAMNIKLLNMRIESVIKSSSAIPARHLIRERDLLVRKWCEYRFLSPEEATLLFADMYRKACRAYVRENLDNELAANVFGLSLILHPGTMDYTQIWEARVRADELGARYEDYLEHCFGFAARRQRKWTPRPNQLHGCPDARSAWNGIFGQLWDDRRPVALRRVDAPQYQLVNDRQLPAQVVFRIELVESLRSSSEDISSTIRRLSVEKRQLKFSDYAPLVAKDYLAEVSQRLVAAALEASTSVALDESDLLQTCFAVPGAADSSNPICAQCVFVRPRRGWSQRRLRRGPAPSIRASLISAKRGV